MAWGFYPTINLQYSVKADLHEALIDEFGKAFVSSKLKVTHISDYTVVAKRIYILINQMPVYISVWIDETGIVNLKGEMINTFYDFGLIEKNINEILDKLTIKLS